MIVLLFAWIWSLEAMGVMKLLSEGGAESQRLRLAVRTASLVLVLVGMKYASVERAFPSSELLTAWAR